MRSFRGEMPRFASAFRGILPRFSIAYVLSPNNVKTDGIITYMPIYMAGLVAAGENHEDMILPGIG